MKKTIILQLKPNKTARHISFEIELEKVGTAKRWDTLEEVEAVRLSVCGSYRLGSGCCQNQDTIRTYRERVKAKDLALFDYILYIWEKYHLNDMKAGTQKQEALISAEGIRGDNYDYDKARETLEAFGLLNDRGYTYGTGWLYRPINPRELPEILELLKD